MESSSLSSHILHFEELRDSHDLYNEKDSRYDLKLFSSWGGFASEAMETSSDLCNTLDANNSWETECERLVGGTVAVSWFLRWLGRFLGRVDLISLVDYSSRDSYSFLYYFMNVDY